MAILRIHKECYTEEICQCLACFFDEISFMYRDGDVGVFRVYHYEVPKDDVVIDVNIIRLGTGIRPMIISWS